MPSRPCWVEISTRALENNFRQLQSLATPEAELLAIVKGDAYGHSVKICAPALAAAGARWLGVTSAEEGAAVRALCPDARILVIGGVFPGQGEGVLANHLTPSMWEHWQFDEIESAAGVAGAACQSVAVHLELDTGMSRQGVSLGAHDPLTSILTRFHPASALRLEGIMTHLYAADESDGAATAEQLQQLDAALERIGELGHWAELLSVGNSASILGGQGGELAALAARHGMKLLIRPGIALYGVVPRIEPEPPGLIEAGARLQPVLSWKSRVVSVRDVPPGTAVGYNGTFVASERMRLALVPTGYADGLDRSLGNRFSLLVRGQLAPIVGRISMDQTVLDVTEIDGVAPGDEVVLIGEQIGQTISSFDHADAAGTIPWEVFTRIAGRVPRTAA